MNHYIITWNTGAKESIYSMNYINALYVNGITPAMAECITEHQLVG